tara:strand:+ start:739 stop:978 length:240 start_codon:yes stop_codon:yes gene_type:complete
LNKVIDSPLFKSFVIYSIFRAFYGAGILIITWLIATETESPLWVSILFLLASMIFSRILFRFLKRFQKSPNNIPENSIE